MTFRTRTTDTRVNAAYTKIDRNPNGSVSSSVVVTSTSKASGSMHTVSDISVRNYKKRIANGEIVMNPAYFETDIRRSLDTALKFGPHSVWGSREFIGNMACIWSIPPVRPAWFTGDVQTAKDITITRAYAKVYSADWQSIVTVAEFGKTVDMIGSSFFRFMALAFKYKKQWTTIRSWKRGKHEKPLAYADRLRRAQQSLWLEFRYGWTPLVFEIQDAMKAYKRFKDDWKPTRLTARAAENLEYSYSGQSTAVPGGLTSCTREYKHRFNVKVASGIIYEVNDPSRVSQAQSVAGLYLRDLPASAWEAVPFSFVVDWFINVGDWLNASFPRPGVRVLGTWRTTKWSTISTNEIIKATIFVNTPPATEYVQRGGTYVEYDVNATRETNLTNPSTPTVRNVTFGFQRTLDAIALAAQQLGSLKR